MNSLPAAVRRRRRSIAGRVRSTCGPDCGRRFGRIASRVILGLAAYTMASFSGVVGEPSTVHLTFFGWSDQHVTVSGDGEHLIPAIDAMNDLPGTAYPQGDVGVVASPEFIVGCGDITEWPTRAARDTYSDLVTKRLKFPSYDVLGNHDEGGKSPSDTMKVWAIERHGALSYAFDRGGVHFVLLFSKYDESLDNPAQPISEQALAFLRSDLERQPRHQPVIVAMHLCLDALTNRDDLIDAVGDANVLMVLSGHYHKAKASTYRNRRFLQLPSPASNGEREIMVVRITTDRLVALPYDYERGEWVRNPTKGFDVPLGPSESVGSSRDE